MNTPSEEPKETERLRLQSLSLSLSEREKKTLMKESMKTISYADDDEGQDYFDIFHEEEHVHALPAYFTNNSLRLIYPDNKV